MHDSKLERVACSGLSGRGELPTYRIIGDQIIGHCHRRRHGLLVISPLSEKATKRMRKARNALWTVDRDIHPGSCPLGEVFIREAQLNVVRRSAYPAQWPCSTNEVGVPGCRSIWYQQRWKA